MYTGLQVCILTCSHHGSFTVDIPAHHESSCGTLLTTCNCAFESAVYFYLTSVTCSDAVQQLLETVNSSIDTGAPARLSYIDRGAAADAMNIHIHLESLMDSLVRLYILSRAPLTCSSRI